MSSTKARPRAASGAASERPALPFHICELSPRRLTAFKYFLNQAGAEIFSSPNAYEVVRFRAGQGMAVIYRNGAGKRERLRVALPAERGAAA